MSLISRMSMSTYVVQLFSKRIPRWTNTQSLVSFVTASSNSDFLIERARQAAISFDFFATGHYVRKVQRNSINFLKVARDARKDQSYFLYGLNSDQLEHIIFPLGEMTKEETRDLARSFGLEVAEKPESQDFVENGSYAEIIGKAGEKPGQIISTSGKLLGVHNGLVNFTVGQRRGINIGGLAEPYYVIRIDARKNKNYCRKKEQKRLSK